MWGAIIGAGAALAGGILGGRAASKAARRKEALLNQMESDNQSWYDRRYNEDYTQTAEALNMMRIAREQAEKRVKRADGIAGVMGGADERVAQEKEAANEVIGNTAANIASHGTARKDAVESQYLQTKNNINQQRMGVYDAKAAAAAQAGSGLMQAGMGMVQNDVLANMFKED